MLSCDGLGREAHVLVSYSSLWNKIAGDPNIFWDVGKRFLDLISNR